MSVIYQIWTALLPYRIFITAALIVLGTQLYRHYTKIYIHSLHTYPIKGCRPLNHTTIQLNRCGFQYDRQWILVDPKLKFISQRNCVSLALIQPAINTDTQTLIVTKINSDIPPLRVPLKPAPTDKTVTFNLWGGDVQAQQYSDSAIHKWFTEAIGTEAILLTLVNGDPERHVRPIDEDSVNIERQGVDLSDISTAYSDGYSLSVLSNASLRDLNKKIVAAGHAPPAVKMSSFRPNIVVDGWGLKPWIEDTWLYNEVAGLTLHHAMPLFRCTVPLIDQNTGERNKVGEPVITLRKYRTFRDRAGQMKQSPYAFGLNTVHTPANGTLQVGDEFHTTLRTTLSDFEIVPSK